MHPHRDLLGERIQLLCRNVPRTGRLVLDPLRLSQSASSLLLFIIIIIKHAYAGTTE
jgi:hypothetical protein